MILAGNKDNHKSFDEFDICQILSLTTELAVLECLKISSIMINPSSAFVFDWIFLNLAGNEDNHKSLN